MADPKDIKVGQVWESKDPRDNGRRVHIENVGPHELSRVAVRNIVTRKRTVLQKTTLLRTYRKVV